MHISGYMAYSFLAYFTWHTIYWVLRIFYKVPYINFISNTLEKCDDTVFQTVLSSGYILLLLSIEYILASLIEMCQE